MQHNVSVMTKRVSTYVDDIEIRVIYISKNANAYKLSEGHYYRNAQQTCTRIYATDV